MTLLLFPHQLFKNINWIDKSITIYLIEEYLFFNQYKFHQQKILFHRASMKYYESYLSNKNYKVNYINSTQNLSDVRKLIEELAKNSVDEILTIDTCDDWLEQRINSTCIQFSIKRTIVKNNAFLNSIEQLEPYFKSKKRYFQTDFYKKERIRLNILMSTQMEPEGGKWTFDDENREKYPKQKTPPVTKFIPSDEFYEEATTYVSKHFRDNYGKININFLYPHTHELAEQWLQSFLEERFQEFGIYEDAIVKDELVINHSLLSPLLNVGLLTPQQVIDTTLNFAEKNRIPINSLEGFIRQLIGWREFIRGVYLFSGRKERTKNFWNFNRKIPASFYNGTTGIEPIDTTIKKIIETGYCHHIERLMILGNFMVLCEFDPNEVYQWFMELFIDSYDWVMVPNVYGMSQFADGGLMATKPYISGSNYLMKMSNYSKGTWQTTWDALFWRFMHIHRDFFLKNPRLGMLVKSFDKMDQSKQDAYIHAANKFLDSLTP